MYLLFLFLHLIIAFLLSVVVLLQRSKGGGLAGAFGGVGAGEAIFGAQGVTTFLHKATIWLAVAFMVSSMGLAILTASRSTNTGQFAGPGAQPAVPVSQDPANPVIDPEAPAVPPGSEAATETEGDDIVPVAVDPEESTDEGGGGSEEGASDEGG